MRRLHLHEDRLHVHTSNAGTLFTPPGRLWKMSAQVQPSAGNSDGNGDCGDARPVRRRRSSLGRALVKLASTVGGGRGSDSEDEGEEATPLALPPTDPRAASDALMGVIDVAASFRDDGMAGAAVQAWTVRVHVHGWWQAGLPQPQHGSQHQY